MNPYSPKEVKKACEEAGIYLSKKRGQNFLIDKNTAEKIVKMSGAGENDVVLEIGPGFGALTRALASVVEKVIAVEIDNKVYSVLREISGVFPNVEVESGDILNFDIKTLPLNYKIVSNLPYSITSPILYRFLTDKNPPEDITIMIQKEVAERILAKDGKNNFLSLLAAFYGKPKLLFNVSRGNFYPKPKVISAVLKIIRERRDYGKCFDEKLFWQIIKAGFSSKRKQLAGNLSKKFFIKRAKIEDIFKNLALDGKIRAEELNLENWIELSKKLAH